MAKNVLSSQEDAPSAGAVRVVPGHSCESGFMGESVCGYAAEKLCHCLAHPMAV